MNTKVYKLSLIKKIGVLWMMPIFISFYIQDIFFFTTLAILPIVVFKNFKNKLNDSNIYFFLGFLLYSFLQSFSDFNEFSFTYLNLFFQGFLVYFIFVSLFDYRDINWLVKIIVFFSLISFIVALIQYYTGTTDTYIINEGQAGLSTHYRIVPRGTDPNYYFLHLILPLCYSMQKLKTSKTIYKKTLHFLILLIFVFAALGTSSKSGLIITLFLFFIIFFRFNRNIFICFLLFFLFILFYPLLSQILPYSFIRFERFFENLMFLDYDSITTNRTFVWVESFLRFLENPLFGVGIGQVVAENSLSSFNIDLGIETTHNSYIHLLAESGLIGFILLFIPIYKIFKKSKALENNLMFYVLLASFLMIFSIDAFYYKLFMVYLSLVVVSNKKVIT